MLTFMSLCVKICFCKFDQVAIQNSTLDINFEAELKV
jgi:hypothetical protein